MTKAKDITGFVYGKLLVIERCGSTTGGQAKWLCKCSCGNEKVISGASLRSGSSKSCGCSSVDVIKEVGLSNRVHGMTNEPVFRSWQAMLGRCLNKNDPAYQRYGGRGVAVHPSWVDFESFYSDVGPRPTTGHSLERIDNNGNYCPGNVMWATAKEQANNRRNNTCIVVGNKTRTLTQWSELSGVSRHEIQKRLKRGCPPSEAVTNVFLPLPLEEEV